MSVEKSFLAVTLLQQDNHMRKTIRRGATLALVFGGVFTLGNVGFGGDSEAKQPAALGVLLNQSESGVTVSAVMPGAPAARAGLRVGDEIRSVDDRRIRTTQELTESIREHRSGSQVDLLILRNGEREIVKATLASDESVFGKRDRQNRGSNAFSYRAISGPAIENEQTLSQELGALHQQISRLQRQIEVLQSRQNERLSEKQSVQGQDWGWNGRGNHNDDPLLFQ
jgi:membrane-associated protease RseP (regulator of RpoE activity)